MVGLSLFFVKLQNCFPLKSGFLDFFHSLILIFLGKEIFRKRPSFDANKKSSSYTSKNLTPMGGIKGGGIKNLNLNKDPPLKVKLASRKGLPNTKNFGSMCKLTTLTPSSLEEEEDDE